jgi:hypothetical protein
MSHFFARQDRITHLRKRVRLHWSCFLPQRLRDRVLRDFRRSLWKCGGPKC